MWKTTSQPSNACAKAPTSRMSPDTSSTPGSPPSTSRALSCERTSAFTACPRATNARTRLLPNSPVLPVTNARMRMLHGRYEHCLDNGRFEHRQDERMCVTARDEYEERTMTTRPRAAAPRRRRTYHHGDLRRALVEVEAVAAELDGSGEGTFAAALEAVAKSLEGAPPKKVIVVPGKLVNLVVA